MLANIKNYFSLVLTACLLSSGNANSAVLCESVFSDQPSFKIARAELAPGIEIAYHHIPTNEIRVKATKYFGETKDILLGISEIGHAYVVSENTRLDGDLWGNYTHFNTHTDLLDSGIIIRIKSPIIDKAILASYKDTKNVSCGKVACGALRKAGHLYVGQKKSGYHTPYHLAQSIFEHGIRDAQGNPVPYEVYYIGSADLKSSMAQVKTSSEEIRNQYIAAGGAITVGVSAVGATILWFLGAFED